MLHHRTDNPAERAADIAKEEADAEFERVWRESCGNFLRAQDAHDKLYCEIHNEALRELSGCC